MRRSVFCPPSTAVVGVPAITKIASPGRSPACSASLPGSTVFSTIVPFWRVNEKSIRSNDERLRWNETNAPRTTPTVRRAISAFAKTDRRIVWRVGRIQWRCRGENRANPLIHNVERLDGFPNGRAAGTVGWILGVRILERSRATAKAAISKELGRRNFARLPLQKEISDLIAS